MSEQTDEERQSKTQKERIMERISMRGTHLEILSSFDLIITTSIMQSDNESMSASVNRNGHRGASIDLTDSFQWQPDMNNSREIERIRE